MHHPPMAPRAPLSMIFATVMVTGCIDYPDVSAVEGPEVADADTPRLVPVQVLRDAEPLEVSADLQAPLDARAAALNARADRLGGRTGVSNSTLARVEAPRDIPDSVDAEDINARAAQLRNRARDLAARDLPNGAPATATRVSQEGHETAPSEGANPPASAAPSTEPAASDAVAERVRRLQERAQGLSDTNAIDETTRSRIDEGVVAPE